MYFLSIMEWVLPIGLGLIIGLLVASRKSHDYSQLIYLEAEEFRQNMRKGQLLDLRKELEYASKKINGSRNFPKRTIFAQLNKIRKDQAVFIYDNTSSSLLRSVGKKLIKKGYHPIYLLKGGLESWTFNLKE